MVCTNRRKRALMVKLADVYYYAESDRDQLPKADVITYYQSSVETPGAKVFHTLLFNLEKSMDELYADVNRRTRADLKKAPSMGFDILHNRSPTAQDILDFQAFSDQFSMKKGITEADEQFMGCLLRDGLVHISTIRSQAGETLCQHVYLADGERARALYSVSIRLELDDASRHKIGVANRALHWSDMSQYRSIGYKTYDFGGIAPNSEDPSLKGITEFKTGFGGKHVVEYHYIKPSTLLGKLALRYTSRTSESL